MPSLILIKSPGGVATGKTFSLEGIDAVVIGRDSKQCQIVLDDKLVSRRHARISITGGRHVVEDLGSRHGITVNQQSVTAPIALKSEDRIKICDFLFRFHDEKSPSSGVQESDSPYQESTIRHSVGRNDAPRILEVQTSDRLRVLLDFSTRLAKTLDQEQLLAQIVDTLFDVFKQADRCCLVAPDDTGRMVPKVVRSRRAAKSGYEDEFVISTTIINKCLNSQTWYLTQDAMSDTGLAGSSAEAMSVSALQLRSVMCAPLITADGKRLGAIQLDSQDIRKQFQSDDLNLLLVVSNIASVAIEKAQVHAALLAREKERQEYEIARMVQVGFLPKSAPDLPGYEFFTYYSPAQSVGGDYYDFIQLPRGRVAVVLGDVAGKGVAAALMMAKLSAEVRFCMVTESDPAKAISLLNEQLIRGGIGDRFVTLAALVIDPTVNHVVIVNAGHVNPIRVRTTSGEATDAINNAESGLPLGLVSGFEYTAKEVTLEIGEALVVFTDGVTDAENPDGRRFLYEGVRRAVEIESVTTEDLKPRGVGERIIRAVQMHAAGRPQSDDIAMVCFGRVEDRSHTGVHKLPRTESPTETLPPPTEVIRPFI